MVVKPPWPAHWETSAKIYPVKRLGDHLYPGRSERRLTGQHGEPNAVVKFEIRGDTPECVHIEITATEEGRGIRTSDLYGFPLEELCQEVLSQPAATVMSDAHASRHRNEREFWAAKNDVAKAQHPKGGKPVPDALLQAIAEDYRSFIDSTPVKVISQKYEMSERTAARRISQARERGFLPPTSKGKKRG